MKCIPLKLIRLIAFIAIIGATVVAGLALLGNAPTTQTSTVANTESHATATGVVIGVNKIEIHTNPNGLAPPSGYAYVAVNLTVENKGASFVEVQKEIYLVDAVGNQYVPTYASVYGVTPDLAFFVGPNENSTGYLLYQMPESATSTDLHLIWHNGRITNVIDILIGPVQTPTPDPNQKSG